MTLANKSLDKLVTTIVELASHLHSSIKHCNLASKLFEMINWLRYTIHPHIFSTTYNTVLYWFGSKNWFLLSSHNPLLIFLNISENLMYVSFIELELKSATRYCWRDIGKAFRLPCTAHDIRLVFDLFSTSFHEILRNSRKKFFFIEDLIVRRSIISSLSCVKRWSKNKLNLCWYFTPTCGILI